jgi:hypothetical protein
MHIPYITMHAMRTVHPRLGFVFDPFVSTRYIYGTEIKPGKRSDARIKPLAYHGRYIAVTPEQTLTVVCTVVPVGGMIYVLHCRYKGLTVSLLKRLLILIRDIRFVSETATWIQN